uniref:Uncharacterized protein n=1 Tax=Arundo donax TaxID=35708 RepID=A0A0A9BD20_ARUDO
MQQPDWICTRSRIVNIAKQSTPATFGDAENRVLCKFSRRLQPPVIPQENTHLGMPYA